MKIAIVDVLGLTYDGTTLLKRGLGGSESAVILMSKELVKLGFDVTVFNDCTSDDSRPGVYDGVEYRPIKDVESVNQIFDIMIGSRSIASFAPQGLFTELPNFTRLQQSSKFKILWMHDTFCQGDELIEDYILEGRINEIFTLSDWHTSYITTCNHGKRRNFEILKNHIFQTRNGIHKWVDWVDVKAKDPDLFVYNASVTKGMVPLVENIWPEVLKQIPNAKLVIIGGFYRFRSEHGPDQQEMDWKQMSEKYKDTITFTGVISQQEISRILAKASYMVYPCGFPETFGISTLEALAHNVPIITCRYGALEETAIDIASYKIPYPVEPNWSVPWLNKDNQVQIFVKTVVDAYNNKYLHQQKMYACNQVQDLCTWDTVALQWKQHFVKILGSFLPIDEYRKITKINQVVRKVFGRTFINEEEVQEPRQQQKNIIIITPVYNAEKYIRNCILSVAQQDYDNYTMYIIDDASTDNTLAVIYDTLEEIGDVSKKAYFEVIENKTNEGAVRNQICTLASDDYNPSDSIVMLLDGDDWLVNDPNIFHKYNNIYKAGAEFTYGSCWSLVDNIPLIAQPYPPEVKANKSYRDYKFNWNMPYTHLRTFKKELFDKLDHSVFQDENGNWLRAGGDTAVFYNILEQANPNNVICVPDIVYNYNDINPLNDYKINGDEQTRTANKVLGKNKPKEKFSVIIPTMWRCPDIFQRALQSYIDNEFVDDIIIVNNDILKTPTWDILKHKKVLVFNQATNLKVNPSWNLGVNTAAQDRVAILNDDIIFDPVLFEKLQGRINKDSGVHGIIAGEAHFNQPLSTDYSIDFVEWKPGDIIHCFGQAMFIHKNNWVHIPNDLEIYFGDDVIMHYHLHKGLTPVMIYNIKFESPMAATSKDTTITGGYYDRELPIYQTWAVQYPWKYKEESVVEELVVEQPKQIKKILIAIPTAKYIEVETFKSIYDLEVPEGYEVDFQYFYGYRIDQIRNLIGSWIVNGYDYLFSVDSDISFKPDTLKKLLASDKDIVGGVYRQRLPEQHLEVYDQFYQRMNWNQISNGLTQIGALGFGCILIKKQVFVDIGHPWFEYHVSLTHDQTVSEDVDFCKKAKQKGYDVWVDPTILCGHHGATTFTVDTNPVVEVKSEVQTRLKQLHDANLFPQEHVNYLKHLSNRITPNVIYDIGACVMHWTNAAKSIWPNATYVLFDAMEEAEFLYGNNLRHMGLLGDENKLVKFYQNLEHPGGNSIFPENTEFSPNARILFPEDKAIWKPMFKLDDVVKAKQLPLPDLIKMDVQGSELNILLGAKETLSRCTDIILELQRVDYNVGAPKEQQVIEYMKSIGFGAVTKFTGNEQSPDCDFHFTRY